MDDLNARLDLDCPQCGSRVIIMGTPSKKVWACDCCGMGYRRTEEGVEEVAPRDYNAPVEDLDDKQWAVMADLGRLRHEGREWDLKNLKIGGAWVYLMVFLGFGALAGCALMWVLLKGWMKTKGFG